MNYQKNAQHVVAVTTAYTFQSVTNIGRNWKRYWRAN